MEQKHFWHVGTKDIILDVLRRNIPSLTESRMLEIGCGNRSVLSYLNKILESTFLGASLLVLADNR